MEVLRKRVEVYTYYYTLLVIMIFPFSLGVLFNPISILDIYYCNFKPFESSPKKRGQTAFKRKKCLKGGRLKRNIDTYPSYVIGKYTI